MENFVGTVDYSNLYTAIKELSNTCRTVTKISINRFTNNFAESLRNSLTAIDTSKPLVNHLPSYKVIYSV